MSATGSGPEGREPAVLTRRLILLGTIAPLAAVSIGVDGGEIFQIIAIDSLGLDPRLIGIALGLGTLSIPLQLWAARMSLERVKKNIQLHLVLLGVMTLATALLVGLAHPGSRVAAAALVIAVLAEVAVSVLLATSWQPIISYALTPRQRQFVLGQGRAFSGVVLLVSVFSFGQLDQDGRVAFLALLSLSCWALAFALNGLPEPAPTRRTQPRATAKFSTEVRSLLTAIGASAIAGWPLLLTYIALVLWPEGNLGVLGGALALGGIVASSLWRDPGDRIAGVLRLGVITFALCSCAIAVFPAPNSSTSRGVLLLLVVVVGSAARALIRTAIIELLHRHVDEDNSVRVMTMMDVIGSTTFQLGFFAVGFLIESSRRGTFVIDPFQVWLILTSIVLAWAIWRLPSSASSEA